MKEKPYYKTLKEKYRIPLSKEATDEEIQEWYEKSTEQSKQLIEKYGEHSWNIFDFANLLRNEEISESHFRELVRFCFDECFKELNKL